MVIFSLTTGSTSCACISPGPSIDRFFDFPTVSTGSGILEANAENGLSWYKIFCTGNTWWLPLCAETA